MFPFHPQIYTFYSHHRYTTFLLPIIFIRFNDTSLKTNSSFWIDELKLCTRTHSYMAHITALKQAFFAKPHSCYLHWNKEFHLTEVVGNDFQRNMPDIEKLKFHNMLVILRYYSVRYRTKNPGYNCIHWHRKRWLLIFRWWYFII